MEATSQITLDLVLSQHCLKTPDDVWFLQVGAFDGVSGDPIYPLVDKYRLKGYLIEPQADALAALKANYARFGRPDFTFVQGAIGERDELVPLYRVKPAPTNPDWFPQVATLDKSFLLGLARYIPNVESLIEEESVPCLTFRTLYQTLDIRRIDLLQIDAEGGDAAILSLFNVRERMPAIIQFEHKHLTRPTHDECLQSLTALGYKISVSRDDTLAYL